MTEVLPFAGVSLRKLNQFPTYQSREDYKARTGKEAPAWDSKRAPKYWEHVGLNTTRRNVVYDDVLAMDGNEPAKGEDGKPYLEPLVLSRPEAESVNIPPNESTVSGADAPSIPVPLHFDVDNYTLDWAPTPFATGADRVIVRDKRATPILTDSQKIDAIYRKLVKGE